MTMIIVFPMLTLLMYGGLSYLFFFFTQHKETELSLKQYEKNLMETEKERLKEKVNSMVRFIRYYDSRSSDKIKKDVKSIVNVTADAANNIYHTYQGLKSDNDIKAMIVAAMKQIKFEGDIGYLFIVDLDGNTVLHVDETLIGKNIISLQDVNGKYIIKEFSNILRRDGEGYVDYYWYIINENHNTMHYKISYVKLLDCYGWYIGAGEYLKYMRKFVKNDVISYLRSNARFNHGHFLLFGNDDSVLFHPHDAKDIDLSPYRTEGFYSDGNSISYSAYIREFGWHLVATRDLDDIKNGIAAKQKINERKHRYNMMTNFFLLGVSWIVSLLLSLYLSVIINRLLGNYEKQINESNEKLIFQSRQALIGELFSMIAHQWRQPVNKIASILARLRFELRHKTLDVETIDAKCEAIEDSIEFISETIDDFRTFYKPKADPEEVDLRDLINQSLFFVDNAIVRKEIRVVKHMGPISHRLYRNEFIQVMLNLIKNAIDVIEHDGTIILRLFQENDAIAIHVENDGHVIDPSILSRIFEPYFTTKKDSMGLGLYMARIIIEKHMQGTLTVEIQNKKTVFIIKLPTLTQL